MVTGYITGVDEEQSVVKGFREKSTRYRAVIRNRRKLSERGMSRFEVRGAETDKGLLRKLAKRLSENDAAAQQLRAELEQKLTPASEGRGGIWRWLRASPLVGSGINLEREVVHLRKIDL